MAEGRTIALAGSPPTEPLARGSVFFVGTATTLIRYGGFTVLTDPNFLHAGDHAHLGYGLTSERLTNPAVEIEDLPELDACVLSHLHGDHWDDVAERGLRHDLPVVTTPHAARVLGGRGFAETHGIDTWEHVTLRRGASWLRITAMPAQHGPAMLHRLLPPTMGSMLEWGLGGDVPAFRMWVSGDTLVHEGLEAIRRRYPDVPLALLHLGGTRILGVLLTMDAPQGVEALRIVQPRRAIPIHYDDYTVFRSSLDDLLRAVQAARLTTEVRVLRRGDRLEFGLGVALAEAAIPAP